MGLRKRLSESREERARTRAKRRDERRRAERAKAGATAADRAQARAERRKVRTETEAKLKADAPGKKKPTAAAAKSSDKPLPDTGRRSSPDRKGRRPHPSAPKPVRALAGGAGKVAGGVRTTLVEVLKLAREMLAIPVQLWLAAAAVAGAFVLRSWQRVVRPVLVGLWRLGRATLAYAERHVTPAHGVFAVALVAVGALAASQWLDYHSVSVGTDAYSGTVGAVAPAPEVESEIAGEAHSWAMLPLAVLALVVLTVAIAGRRRAAALLIPIGLAVIAITLIVDLPKGLDEGSASVAYEGASATLLEGFWMQLATGAVLVACGLLMPRYLRREKAPAVRPTGPTLFQQAAAAIRKRARKPVFGRRRRPPRARPKSKVQGARL